MSLFGEGQLDHVALKGPFQFKLFYDSRNKNTSLNTNFIEVFSKYLTN